MNEFKLRDLIEIRNGARYYHLKDGDIPVFGSGGIMCYVNDYLYDGEVVLLPRKGTLNNIMFYSGKLWSVDTMYYAIVNEKANPYYLYSYLKLLDLKHLDSGSTLPSMTKSAYNDLIIKLPKINVQKKISDFLYDLEAKIQVNNKINSELESMAKLMYDYWFVQFDFPDENGRPYKSSGGKMIYNEELKREIPEGWEVSKISSLMKVGKDQLTPSENPEKEFKHLSIPVFDKYGGYSLEKGNEIGSSKFIVEKYDILVSKLNPWFNRVYYAPNEDNIICTTEMVVWRNDNLFSKNFFYYLARSERFITFCTQSATGTSNSHKRVSPSVMMGYKIAYNADLIEEFGGIVDPWIKKYNLNKDENRKLAELRDWLLPMLMNGQVTVK